MNVQMTGFGFIYKTDGIGTDVIQYTKIQFQNAYDVLKMYIMIQKH